MLHKLFLFISKATLCFFKFPLNIYCFNQIKNFFKKIQLDNWTYIYGKSEKDCTKNLLKYKKVYKVYKKILITFFLIYSGIFVNLYLK